MELKKAIEQRRSIRQFKIDNVSDDSISELLESARLSQSAKNRQPWIFGVLKGKRKDYVADLMINWCDTTSENIGTVRATANAIKEASVLIVVFREPNNSWKKGDLLSIGSAIQHICLRATDLGLGSLWIRDTYCVDKEICKSLGQNHLELVSTVAVGYPSQNPKLRPRKTMKEMVVFYDK